MGSVFLTVTLHPKEQERSLPGIPSSSAERAWGLNHVRVLLKPEACLSSRQKSRVPGPAPLPAACVTSGKSLILQGPTEEPDGL